MSTTPQPPQKPVRSPSPPVDPRGMSDHKDDDDVSWYWQLLAGPAFGGEVQTQTPTPKKSRTPAVEDDLICPITLQLPYEPVTAEDGRVYERSAIEDYIKSKKGMGVLKSPITRAIMGTKLLPSSQTKNIIETLITTNVISGELATNWIERDQLQKQMDEVVQRAKTGDAEAMCYVGLFYFSGKNGFPQDYKMAYNWLDKASLAGDPDASHFRAMMLLRGEGVTRNEQKGIQHLRVAAINGNVYAAYRLGRAFADGKYGLPINKTEAIMWLQKAAVTTSTNNKVGGGNSKGGGEYTKERAKAKLKELEEMGLGVTNNNLLTCTGRTSSSSLTQNIFQNIGSSGTSWSHPF